MNFKRLHVLILMLAMTALSVRPVSSQTNAPIPWSEIGAKVGADYPGERLAMSPAEGGARLRCVFQRLEGDAMRDGLWLSSTVANTMTECFRVVATAIGRSSGYAAVQDAVAPARALPDTGTVLVAGKLVRFIRPGVIEEYSVSTEGVRQDFVVTQRPEGAGELRLQLDVSGAKVQSTAYGVQLVLPRSKREIAYGRLRVTDAMGNELPARIDVERGAICPALAVLVNDADAVYPVRIDPTFSDANWSAMGSGINDVVASLAVSGNDLYAGGHFTTAGEIATTNIAKWNGNTWSAVGPGMNGYVTALAISGSDLFAGGDFTAAGTNAISRIARWNGSSWSGLGGGMNDYVRALTVAGNSLYAGGRFTKAGEIEAYHIARWNGSNWSALGEGMGGGNLIMGTSVYAFAVSGSDVYVGGNFTMATNSGGVVVTVNNVAKWNGSSWSALGSGMDRRVYALAISGSDLYVAGAFQTAGGANANFIAKWNGSSWSPLGSGMSSTVTALAVSGTDLYAGGSFGTAGGNVADRVAKWDGSSWSALGSGMEGAVGPLAVSGSSLYAGGVFIFAGGKPCTNIARAYLERPALSILRSGSNVTLSWPTFYESFTPQQNPETANSNGWSNANYPFTTNGAIKSATVPLTTTNQYFRLIGN